MHFAPPYRHRLASLAAFVSTCGLCHVAAAQVNWQGDFESGDTSQWSFVLNAPGITVVDDVTLEGSHAGRIAINDSAEHIWPNGLNRVEFQYAHPAEETAEGADSYFGWSFMVPSLLTEDGHQIGYYESDSSYQQVMSFPVAGDTIRFVTRRPSNQEHWVGSGMVQAGAWHDIVIHVHWSKQADEGQVDVWFDGEQVVTAAAAETLADDNPHFVQLGILRDTIASVEVMYIDNARAGTTLQDVLALVPSDPGGSGGASGDTGGASSTTGGATSSTGGAASGGAGASSGGATASGGSGAGTASNDEGSEGDAGGCSLTAARSTSNQWWLLALAVFLLGVARTRRVH